MVNVTGYTQAGADSLLAAKANTADLAPVATSGAYSSLTGLPTIPAAQVASDWTASTGVAAILNKPTLGTAAAQDVTAFATAAQGALAATAVQPAGSITGNAATATKLATARTIAGKSFDGTANITLAATDVGAATTAQGAKADTAVQPGSLATVATTGSYNDLSNKPSTAGYTFAPAVGSYIGLTRSTNAATKFTVGTEYAIGITLPDMTIDKLIITVTAAGAAGSTMLVGLRPLTGNPGTYGAPLFTAAFSTATASTQPVYTLGTPVAITAGAYALTWCQSIDSAATATVQYAPAEANLKTFPLAQSTSVTAVGHGPVVASINTGVTSATALPTTVVIGNNNTNQASNNVPQVIAHRSA